MEKSVITPEEALQRLKDGNARYVNNSCRQYDYKAAIKKTSEGQFPFAVIIGCVDSRKVPEFMFDQNIGDIFSVRVAGNVISKDVLASIEFSCIVSTARLVVVCGHSDCGAIKGACDGVTTGHLAHLLGKIQPAVQEAKDTAGNLEDAAFRDLVSEINVRNSIKEIKEKSPLLRELIDKGEVRLTGAFYDISSGVITFMD